MAEGSQKINFNSFLEANNTAVKMAKETYDRFEKLNYNYSELKSANERLLQENESLRQRMSNESEINHRSYQSNSEDVTSRNKRSDVLKKYQAMDGTKRRQAIEAFGKLPIEKEKKRTELWYRKDLTCRIFVIAYDIARCTRDAFNQKALPRFFQCAPTVGIYGQRGDNSLEASQLIQRSMQQSLSTEMESVLSTESFKVNCCSVLKEMAVSCDLTDMEKEVLKELKKHNDQWRKSEPWLPLLDDEIISKMTSYITDCVRIAWRMVNLLPPLKIVSVNQVHGEKFNEFFDKEEEEVKEKTPTIKVCIRPAVSDYISGEVLIKGTAAIIPKPKQLKNQQVTGTDV